MSLASGIFPEGFKTALIHPVYKGGGKLRNAPASYRPVAILCAMSKVLETVAKEDLEGFMKANDILPAWQRGFRKGALVHHGPYHSPCGMGLGQQVQGGCCDRL
jgi:hypothetical protein